MNADKKFKFHSFSIINILSTRILAGLILVPSVILVSYFEINKYLGFPIIIIPLTIYHFWHQSLEYYDVRIAVAKDNVRIEQVNKISFLKNLQLNLAANEIIEIKCNKKRLGFYQISIKTTLKTHKITLYKPNLNEVNECLLKIKHLSPQI